MKNKQPNLKDKNCITANVGLDFLCLVVEAIAEKQPTWGKKIKVEWTNPNGIK